MSYDVDIGCPHCSHTLAAFNYTYNLSPMFRWALGGDGINDLNGLTVGDAIPKLEAAIAKCEADGDLSRWDSPNGWGHGSTALEFLRNILKAAKEHPGACVRVF